MPRNLLRQELSTSMRQAIEIEKGRLEPDRVTRSNLDRVKIVSSQSHKTQ